MKISVYEGPKKFVVQEVPDMDIQDDEVRIKTLYTGISHGTEMNVYRGYAPFFNKKYDPETRLFVDSDEEQLGRIRLEAVIQEYGISAILQ